MITLDESVSAGLQQTFLFRRSTSFEPLLRFWRSRPACHEAGRVEELVALHPRLLESFERRDQLDELAEQVEELLTSLLPPAFEDRALAVMMPFTFEVLAATPAFRQTFYHPDGTPQADLDDGRLEAVRNRVAYSLILDRIYGLPTAGPVMVPARSTGAEPGLVRYLEFRFDSRFLEITCQDGSECVCPAASLEMLEESERLAHIRPERYQFSGFTMLEAVDVTSREAISRLKLALVDRHAFLDPERFEAIQSELRNLLGLNDLSLGFGALREDEIYVFNTAFLEQRGAGLAGLTPLAMAEMNSQKSQRLLVEKKPMVMSQKADGGSLLAVPLLVDGQVRGVLELTCARPQRLNAHVLSALEPLLPIFAVAAEHTIEELDRRVQAVMKEQFTAIHPAVEWRFRQVALNFLRSQARGENHEVEPLIFEGVHLLSGVSDIRHASRLRSQSVAADLIHGLSLAEQAVAAALLENPFPFLEERRFRLRRWLNRVEAGLDSGDELEAVDFLRSVVEPMLRRIEAFGPRSRAAVEAYFSALDEQLGVVYQRRRDYDLSVTQIRETVAQLLAREQRQAQEMLPHYFELQKSDGIDHTAYIGASLNQNGQFDPLYLKNLRIWQLMVMCVAARKTEEMRAQLPLELDCIHLILVQNEPVKIRFLQEEKQFGVEGDQNARYAQVRKRLHKAEVLGGRERLGQRGKVAVVYSRPQEAAEYQEYIAYLRSLGYITPRTERLELEPLEGVRGLKALRVTVESRAGQTGKTIERTLTSLAKQL
ncbi:MAG: GAF domain-containing protein [Vulcanimicrobiota bacterium]